MNNDNTNNLDYDQTEEEARTYEVSDDALEAASGASAPGICRGLQRKVAAWRPFPLRLPKLAASSFQTKRAVAYWPLSTFAAAIGERLEAKRTWLKCARYGAVDPMRSAPGKLAKNRR